MDYTIFGSNDNLLIGGDLINIKHKGSKKSIGEFGILKSSYKVRKRFIHFSSFEIYDKLKGHGQQFLSSLITDLRKLGYGGITLGCDKENKVAMHIYEKFGFVYKKKRELYVLKFNELGIKELEARFDYFNPAEIAPGVWTKGKYIDECSKFFEGCKKVLDIGSGIGKVVTILSMLNPDTKFVGVEVDPKTFDKAERARKYFGTKNSKFILNDFCNLRLGSYDGFFIFNPFIMSDDLQDDRKSENKFFRLLKNMKSGTKLAVHFEDFDKKNLAELDYLEKVKEVGYLTLYIKK